MTREQAKALVDALGASDLETIKAVREAKAILETAVLELQARLRRIEQEWQRRVVAALQDDGGQHG